MATELADIQIEVLKDVNDDVFDPITCTLEEFGALQTLDTLGLIHMEFEQIDGKRITLTDAGREQIEEYLV